MQTKKIITHKRLTAVVAAAMVIALLITGTFAWSQLSNKVNEFSGRSLPGAKLRDDFDPSTGNKDVYVENTGDTDFFARIMLNEYMEIYNSLTDQYQSINNSTYHATEPGTDGREKDVDADEWRTHAPDADGDITNICDEDFHRYWEWEMGGLKDITLTGPTTTGRAYTTPNAKVMTYEQWVDAAKPKDTWVLCADGYFYYSVLVEKENTTGLLLDAVNNVLKPSADYYYAIDVILEVITPDDLNAWLNGSIPSNQTVASNEASADAKDLLTGLSQKSATGIKINSSNISMKIGEEQSLSASLSPTGTTDILGALTWESSDSDVVSVDETGKIIAIKKGTAKITVLGNGFTSAPITVTVSDAETPPIEPDVILDLKENVKINGLGIEDDLSNDDPTLIYPYRSIIYGNGATINFDNQTGNPNAEYCWFKLSDLFTSNANYNPELLEFSDSRVDIAQRDGQLFIRSKIYPTYADWNAFISANPYLDMGDWVFSVPITMTQGDESVTFNLLHKYDGGID